MSPKEFEEVILKRHPEMLFQSVTYTSMHPNHRGELMTKVMAYLPAQADRFSEDAPKGIARTMYAQYVLNGGRVVKDRHNLFGKNPTASPFKVGDLITGDDRSIPRSIYHFNGYRDGKAVVRFVAYDGHLAKKDENNEMLWPISELERRHVASYDEIISAMHAAPPQAKPRVVLIDVETSGLNGEVQVSGLVETPADQEALTRIRDAWQKTLDSAPTRFRTPIIDNLSMIVDTEGGKQNLKSLAERMLANLSDYRPGLVMQDAPAQCDCGAEKAGTHAHAHWCDTQKELKS